MLHNLVDSVAFKIVGVVKIFDSDELLKSSPRLLSLFNKIGFGRTTHNNGREKRVGMGGRRKGLSERGEIGREGVNV